MLTANTAQAPATLQVFLSSTVNDYAPYRSNFKDALNKTQTACYLSEDWVTGYVNTTEECKRRVLEANGFVLLLGHWYGSIPDRETRSITHLEFCWAFEKWKDDAAPRMVVMEPKIGSPADEELRKAAEAILVERGVDAVDHARRLRAFHDQVTGSWRIVTRFLHVADLREHAIMTCMRWRGIDPLAMARGGELPSDFAPLVPKVTDEQLGGLGRKPHIEVVERALNELEVRDEVPAVAFLIRGHEDAGARALLCRLFAVNLKGYRNRTRGGVLPFDTGDVAHLVAWVGGAIGLPPASAPTTPEGLAERVASALARQSLAFSLSRVAAFAGGVRGFHDAFWAPFYARLRALREEKPFEHRLVAVIVDQSADSRWSPVTRTIDDDHDDSRLLALPELGNFRDIDVIAWLREMSVPAQRRKAIADRAVKNDEGAIDGLPIRVFGRLRNEDLVPEGGPE